MTGQALAVMVEVVALGALEAQVTVEVAVMATTSLALDQLRPKLLPLPMEMQDLTIRTRLTPPSS